MNEQLTVKFIDWNSPDGFAARSIRFNVFVDEQKVPAQLELDETDLTAIHALAILANGSPCGTGRLFPDPGNPTAAHIGRMAVLKEHRQLGCGSALLSALIDHARDAGYTTAILSAQIHAQGFYQRHGFNPIGEIYEEAGIPHQAMQRKL